MFWGVPPAKVLRFDASQARPKRRRDTILVPDSVLKHRETFPNRFRAHVDVVLPESAFLKRKITAPLKARKSIPEIAKLDLMRQTPFELSNVHTALSAPIKRGKELEVWQYVIRRQDTEELSSSLLKSNWIVRRFLTESGEVIADFTEELAAPLLNLRRLNLVLVLCLAGCLAAQSIIPIIGAKEKIAVLENETLLLRAKAVALQNDVQDLSETRMQAEMRLTEVLNWPKLSGAMASLSEHIPDEAFLELLTMQSNKLNISGQTTGSPSELALSLAKLNEFEDPTLDGVVSNNQSNVKRFGLSLKLGDVVR